MLNALFRSIFGTKHERDVKRMRPIVAEIGALEPALQALSQTASGGRESPASPAKSIASCQRTPTTGNRPPRGSSTGFLRTRSHADSGTSVLEMRLGHRVTS